jgi:hypothetical protein
LRSLGLRGLDPGEGPNKDTESVFRYKFSVIGGGGVKYPTKIEISFRPRFQHDAAPVEQVPEEVVAPYLLPGSSISMPHYDRAAAMRQKVEALVGRQVVQARDVFDLSVLGLDGENRETTEFLIRHIAQETLESALSRVFEISFAEFVGQVVEFLSDEARERYGTPRAWDETRLAVAGGIEELLRYRRRRA